MTSLHNNDVTVYIVCLLTATLLLVLFVLHPMYDCTDAGERVLDDVMERKRKHHESKVAATVQEVNRVAEEKLALELKRARLESEWEMETLRKVLDLKRLEDISMARRFLRKEMEEETRQLLQKASDEAARNLEDSLKRCTEAANEELQRAVERTRQEERAAAEKRSDKQAEEAKAHLDACLQACERDNERALSDLRELLLQEKARAVECMQQSEASRKEREMGEQAYKFHCLISELQAMLARQVKAHGSASVSLRQTTVKLETLQSKYDDLMREFKHFIDTTPKMSSNFLL